MDTFNQLAFDFFPKEKIDDLIIVKGGAIYYSSVLCEVLHHMDRNSLKVRRSEYRKGKSKNYRHFTEVVDGVVRYWYDAATIPKEAFDKFNLPSIIDSSKHFSKALQTQIAISQQPPEDLHGKGIGKICKTIQAKFEGAIARAYQFDYLFLRSLDFANEAHLLSQKYALLLELIDLLKTPHNKNIKGAHLILMTPTFNKLGFSKNLSSFYPYIQRAIESTEKENGLVDFVKGKWNVKDNARKVNDIVLELICQYSGHPNAQVSHDKVRIWVNVILIAFPSINGKRILELSIVQKYVVENEVKIFTYRNSQAEVRKAIVAYLHMESARNPMDQFFMDEWYIDFVCKSSNKRIRKILIGMMDGRSKKLVHYLSVRSLNKEVVKEFIHEVVRRCRNKMPAELVCDFASYNVCGDIKRIFNYLVYKYKSKFYWTTTSTANRKNDIERFWGTVGSFYISALVGAVGPAITSERDNAHPAKIITLFINDPAFLEDEQRSDEIVYQMLDKYCKKGIHANTASPNEIYTNNEKVNALSLEPADMAFLFGKLRKRKLIRSQVTVGKTHYQLFAATLVGHMGDDVDCYSYPDYPHDVFVYESDSADYIGTFKNYELIPKAKINQTDADREMLSNMYKLQQGQLEAIMAIKQTGLAKLKEATGGVDIGEVGMFLIESLTPEKHTTVAYLNPQAQDKIDINLFNLGGFKEAKKAGKGTIKKPTVSSKGLLTDNVQHKYA